MRNLNILILSKNMENYTSGYYHNDLVKAVFSFGNVFLYGEGYSEYNGNDRIEDVIAKSPWQKNKIDLVVVGTSWEEQNMDVRESDPHPNINLSSLSVPKIFFLNKEYKKIKEKIEYIKKNKFTIVATVLPEEIYSSWEKETKTFFTQSHFGINIERFYSLNIPRIYDFTFAGSLHQQHTNLRQKVKNHLFKSKSLFIKSNRGIWRIVFPSNPLNKEFQKYSIYWAEWSSFSRDFLGRNLLPFGEKYVNLMNSTKVFFNTLSAKGILNTRFFELMATKTLIFCPEEDYYGILKNNYNAIMFKKDLSNFDERLKIAIENNEERNRIIENAHEDSLQHTYENRIAKIIRLLDLNK